MKQYEAKKKTGKNGKGFYIALGLCLLAVGVAAWTTFDSVNNFTAEEGISSSKVLQTEQSLSGVKVPSSSASSGGKSSAASSEGSSGVSSKTSSEASSSGRQESSSQSSKSGSNAPDGNASAVQAGAPSSPAPSVPTPEILQYPLGSSVSVDFSGDSLIYSKTMQDWRAHTGVDIPANKGDTVKACAAGIVSEVYGEGLYGLTIAVQHGELTVFYCGLDTVSVKKGDFVGIGETLGSLGSIPCEELDGGHLHLEAEKDGKRIDPAELLK